MVLEVFGRDEISQWDVNRMEWIRVLGVVF